jgi:hypothetical protein
MAVMLFILPGKLDDVSTALYAFFASTLRTNCYAGSGLLSPANASRTAFYCEEVDIVLRKHESSLRHMYAIICKFKPFDVNKGLANKLIAYSDWCRRPPPPPSPPDALRPSCSLQLLGTWQEPPACIRPVHARTRAANPERPASQAHPKPSCPTPSRPTPSRPPLVSHSEPPPLLASSWQDELH